MLASHLTDFCKEKARPAQDKAIKVAVFS